MASKKTVLDKALVILGKEITERGSQGKKHRAE
jgi:hypothetical protein